MARDAAAQVFAEDWKYELYEPHEPHTSIPGGGATVITKEDNVHTSNVGNGWEMVIRVKNEGGFKFSEATESEFSSDAPDPDPIPIPGSNTQSLTSEKTASQGRSAGKTLSQLLESRALLPVTASPKQTPTAPIKAPAEGKLRNKFPKAGLSHLPQPSAYANDSPPLRNFNRYASRQPQTASAIEHAPDSPTKKIQNAGAYRAPDSKGKGKATADAPQPLVYGATPHVQDLATLDEFYKSDDASYDFVGKGDRSAGPVSDGDDFEFI
jgi:hypothetical protein